MSAKSHGTDEPLDRFTVRGLDWVAEPDTAALVRDQVAGRIDELESEAGASLVKRNMVRAVFRMPLHGFGSVIVKRYAVRGPFDWVKYTFRASRALEEWRVGRWLDEAGIATAIPLAMAERRRGVLQDAALVTREIKDAVHLNEYVEEHLVGDAARDLLRHELFDRLVRIVRRMHDRGFVHNDLHGGNILVTGPADASVVHIIDLHSVSRYERRTPPAGKRWFDLLKLLHSLRTCSSPAEREQMCRTYDDAGSGPSGTRVTALLRSGDLSEVLERRLFAMERKRVRSRTRRSLDRSSRHDVTQRAGFRIHHLRTIAVGDLLPLIDAHRESLRAGGPAVLKDARRSALTRQTLSTGGVSRSVVVKEYRCASLSTRLKALVRRPRPISAWVAGNGLGVRGFDAAQPLALLMKGRGPAMSSAYIVMEDLGEAQRLDLIALDRFAGDLDDARRAEKHRLLDCVANVFRRLHDEGVYHGDMKAVNLFLREGSGAASVVLADYDRVEFDTPVIPRRRIKNLAQLSASIPICISLADRLRFFREYAKEDDRTRRVWKRWFERIIADCRRKIVVRTQPIE